MSMLKKDILASFEDTIRNASKMLDGRYEEILNVAITDYSRQKPLVGITSLDLIADQSVYDAPTDLIGFKNHDWGRANRRRRDPWNSPKVVSIPDVKVVPGANGQAPYRLALSPVPNAEELSIAGSTMQIFYTKEHVVSDVQVATDRATTIPKQDRDLFLLRMQAEAMLQLSFLRVSKVSIKDPITNVSSRAGEPSVMAKELLVAFYRGVAL
ncbi:MAG: hypothetical protein COA86_02780 [Kangiella sp.]|nr:MAG: hypothetical protein COA86_02780 [Kangiella sp.]